MVTDDLDGVLVCTNGTVAAQTPELALGGALGCGVRSRLLFQRQVGYVVVDTQGEHVLGLVLSQLFVYCEDRCRRSILGTQTVTAAGNNDVVLACVAQSGNNVEVQRLALCARLLGAVEDCNLLCGLRDSCQELVSSEGTVQTNLNQTNLLALSGQVVDNFLSDVADGAHCDDDALCVRCAVVVEQLIVGAQLCVDLCHVLFNDARYGVVELVAGLTMLEEDVAVLVRAAHDRMLRVQSALAERLNSVHIAHLSQVAVIPNLNLLNLVRGTETVEEVDERNTGLDGCQMRNSRQVHDLLRIGLAQHCETGLAASHNVRVIAENVQRVRSYGTRGYVEDTGEQLACDLVHVRDHQQKTLRSGVGGGQSACSERAVNRTSCACLGLHLDYLNRVAEDVLLASGSPLVNVVCHGARGGNRIDTRDFSKCIRHMSRSSITVHGLHFSCHVVKSSLMEITD